MGASIKKSNKSKSRNSNSVMSEINVTPFVDVMLVLLIIFMVTAPMMTVGVPVDLPEAKAPNINEEAEPLTVSIDESGAIYIQETVVELESIPARLQAIGGENPETRIFVRGDKKLDYGRIMQVMGVITSAGYKKVALLTELPKKKTTS